MSLLLSIVALVAPVADWRELATEDDRRRLRSWRDAWMATLPQARRGGGAAVIAAEGPLFNPDRNLRGPIPPEGEYRCRTFKLGSQRPAGLDFIAYPWFRCRIGADGAFSKLDGSQRPVGTIHRHTSDRAVFLGTLSLGDERRVLRYGRDRNRDMAALVERVGERRWRMVFPYPRFESLLDVIELVPASVGTTGGGTTAGVGITAGPGSGASEAR